MTHHTLTAGIAAGVSLPALAVSFFAQGLPAVQFIAAALSCVVSGVFLWNWIKGKR